MSLDNYKITQNDIETKGVVAAPDVLKGDPKENKKLFDRLIREAVAVQFNAMVDALTASSGASEIGAAVDGIAAGTVLGVLSALKVLHDSTAQTQGATNESVQAALGNRYTKDQTDALLQGKLDTVTANQLVRAIEFNAETGVFTITTQGGAVSTIDTMLERVPASFTLENNQLVLTLEDGTRQTADLSAFIDTYTFSSGGTVSFSQNGKTITAEVRDGSLALSKLTPEAQATLASYASRAEAAKESAEAARAGAEVARDAAQTAETAAREKAAAAEGSATAAKQSEINAQKQADALFTAEVDENGHLVYTQPDGNERDLGNVTGGRGPSGVYVGDDEPTDEDVLVWFTDDGAVAEVFTALVGAIEALEKRIEALEQNGGGTGGGESVTTSLLGNAILGKMILGG